MRTTWPRGVLLPALVLLAPPLLGAARSATRRVADPREASTLELPADWQTWADGSRLMALAPGARSSARL